jgi:uncharacterized protein YbjT (DUF2867 family)
MKILVTGGTGTVGSAVVRELLARGHDPYVLTRDANKAGALPAGAKPVLGDLLDVATIRSAFRGMDGLFLLNSVSTTEAHEGLLAVNGAMLGGVKKIVYMSVQDLTGAAHLPHFGAKIGIEEAVRGSKIAWTILRPNNFYQNDFWFKQALLEYGVYPQPLGSIGTSRVDVRDIAEAAAIALTQPGHDGRTYDLVGPEAWTGPTTTAVWARALGRPIAYGGEDMDAWERQNAAWFPAWMAFDFRRMYEHFQVHGLQATPQAIAALTGLLGHPPRGFEAFVQETAASWA